MKARPSPIGDDHGVGFFSQSKGLMFFYLSFGSVFWREVNHSLSGNSSVPKTSCVVDMYQICLFWDGREGAFFLKSTRLYSSGNSSLSGL